jgi:hypothetical protein
MGHIFKHLPHRLKEVLSWDMWPCRQVFLKTVTFLLREGDRRAFSFYELTKDGRDSTTGAKEDLNVEFTEGQERGSHDEKAPTK